MFLNYAAIGLALRCPLSHLTMILHGFHEPDATPIRVSTLTKNTNKMNITKNSNYISNANNSNNSNNANNSKNTKNTNNTKNTKNTNTTNNTNKAKPSEAKENQSKAEQS